MNLQQRHDQLAASLARFGQEHLLRFWDELDSAGRARLLDDIEQLDLERMSELIQTHVLREPPLNLPADIRPPDILPNEPGDAGQAGRYGAARERGEELIRGGQVACLTVAGGQGTRLGFDGPKGALPISPIRRKTLFQIFAEQIRNAQEQYDIGLMWLIMTSPTHDAETRAFFAENGFFGLREPQVIFFTQGVMPAVDLSGRMLLAEKGRLAFSPDGHGGTLRALHRSGVLERVVAAGVKILSYFQVDNPLIHPVDPLFIGLHDQTGSQISSKTIPKASPTERVGNFCLSEGRLLVIEYSDLPEELAHATDDAGRRLFDAASIAIHLFDTDFVAALNRGGFRLPIHRAEKKTSFVDAAGRRASPDRPNAVKLETFVFDALPLAERTMLWQTRREEEFAPAKNATGVDSIETARAAMVARSARWLIQAGVEVPARPDGSPDAVIEISPLLAESAEQLARSITPADVHVARGGELHLGPEVDSKG